LVSALRDDPIARLEALHDGSMDIFVCDHQTAAISLKKRAKKLLYKKCAIAFIGSSTKFQLVATGSLTVSMPDESSTKDKRARGHRREAHHAKATA